jgi:hypothetical protein
MTTQEVSGKRLDGDIVDISSDEEEQYDLRAESVPTLISLNNEDYSSIETCGKELRGSCIQAVIETIHRDAESSEISSVNTDFYSYLTQNKKREAKRLLHPDDRAISQSKSEWTTPKIRRATANSRVLLIPCHMVEIDEESQTEMRHCVLVARIRMARNTCKFFIPLLLKSRALFASLFYPQKGRHKNTLSITRQISVVPLALVKFT